MSDLVTGEPGELWLCAMCRGSGYRTWRRRYETRGGVKLSMGGRPRPNPFSWPGGTLSIPCSDERGNIDRNDPQIGGQPRLRASFRWFIGRRANVAPIPGGRSYYRSGRGSTRTGGKVPPRLRGGQGRGRGVERVILRGARDTLLPVAPAAEDNFQPIDAPVRTVGPATPQGSREVPPVISPRRPGAHASPSLYSSGDERLKVYPSGALSDAERLHDRRRRWGLWSGKVPPRPGGRPGAWHRESRNLAAQETRYPHGGKSPGVLSDAQRLRPGPHHPRPRARARVNRSLRRGRWPWRPWRTGSAGKCSGTPGRRGRTGTNAASPR